ncbi:HAD family hydrolase [Streptomyces sp. SID5785]|uniref:HAD family hydrolase n=1 Tax=Streptomyces sp. SID5785 TaxID=2690309 RepID=UPI0031BA469A
MPSKGTVSGEYGSQVLALFDLDNTLIDRQAGLDTWVRQFVRARGLECGAEVIIRERLSERAYPSDFETLRARLGLAEPADALWQEYISGVARSVRCFPGVPEALSTLRAEGWTLGIATNGAGEIQRAKLAATGLASAFDGICVSEEIGSRKPELAHFEAAASLSGRRLSEGGWMIGDNPTTDIGGACAAGLRTAWVSHGCAWAEGPHVPDIEAESVVGAIEALRARER